MSVMARERKLPPGNRKPGFTFNLDPALVEQVEKMADQQRRSRNQMASILLEEALAQHGCWPPPEKQ